MKKRPPVMVKDPETGWTEGPHEVVTGGSGYACMSTPTGISYMSIQHTPLLWDLPVISGPSPGARKFFQGHRVTGFFPLDLHPAHTSQCGEDPTTAWPFLSPDAWVSCPICQLPFGVAEVEQHASNCGETAGALSSPQCLQ
ncbi:hypothetical protein DUI87_11129 [Hirundo rustica rustica]|uniref:Uncharacterized protein n=1 Tax=Hirundo rustica rustica TaxID=333673 RepID=A0A3M0KFT3_HIRRU|nr:hypothetical protein DUI87_11129 [Hirundo rustica rustica]